MAKIDFSICTKPDEYINEQCAYDIIGDVHGCYDMLAELLGKLGYTVENGLVTGSPEGRRLVFLGDLCDRGNRSFDCVLLARAAVENGAAVWLLGNHDDKLRKWLLKSKETDDPDRARFLELNEKERTDLADFIATLPDHLILDGGRLVVVHGGISEELIGEQSSKCRAFALYGATTGRVDENGLPIREDWTESYSGEALVVYGHTPVQEPRVNGNTIDIDTGAFNGGALTALMYPEMEYVIAVAVNQ